MEVLPTGQVSGLPKNTLKKLIQIEGNSQEECEKKVTEFLERCKNG
jgi:hypothetical protein